MIQEIRCLVSTIKLVDQLSSIKDSLYFLVKIIMRNKADQEALKKARERANVSNTTLVEVTAAADTTVASRLQNMGGNTAATSCPPTEKEDDARNM